MAITLRDVAVIVAIAILAILAAVFFVFAGVFTDAPGGLLHPERLVSYALVVLSHAVIAGGAAAVGPWRWRAWAAFVATPGLFILLLYGAAESGIWDVIGIYALLVAASSAGGAWGGHALRTTRRGSA